ncbi:hypothetical protein Nmel_011485 [Mimus melanotis]
MRKTTAAEVKDTSTAEVSSIQRGPCRGREQRILLMVLLMVVCFLLCWLPYAAVALIATFGQPGLISPAASIVPAILAKSSTVYNPIIYVFLNKQVSEALSSLHLDSVYARSEKIARGDQESISDITQIQEREALKKGSKEQTCWKNLCFWKLDDLTNSSHVHIANDRTTFHILT